MLERTFAGCGHIKEYLHLLSRFKGVLHHLRMLRIHLRIVLAIARDWKDVGNVLRIEGSTHHVFQFNRTLPIDAYQRTKAKQ